MAASAIIYPPWLGGKPFDVFNPTVADISIVGIAHSLSQLCRYNGHCKHFYSDAQHSILVARLCPPDLALEGLLHDAPEGLGIGDMISPVKRHLPDYQRVDDHMLFSVAERFNLDFPLPEAVKIADAQAYMLEVNHLFDNEAVAAAMLQHYPDVPWPTMEVEPSFFQEKDRADVRSQFLSVYENLRRD